MADGGILIIGGGIAGQALCEAIRERERDVPVTLLCAEPHVPYDRVRLSELLAGVDARAADTLGLRPAEWYEDQRIEVRLGCRAEAIDLQRGTALTPEGAVGFSRLALATARGRCCRRSRASAWPVST